MFENREYVRMTNQSLYHLIMFVSFFVAIKLLPWLEVKVAGYVTNSLVLTAVSFVLAYVSAIYILPEVGFMLIRSASED